MISYLITPKSTLRGDDCDASRCTENGYCIRKKGFENFHPNSQIFINEMTQLLMLVNLIINLICCGFPRDPPGFSTNRIPWLMIGLSAGLPRVSLW